MKRSLRNFGLLTLLACFTLVASGCCTAGGGCGPSPYGGAPMMPYGGGGG